MAAPKTKRQEKIQQLIRRQGQVTVAEMCAKFNISEATARRDLEELSAQGALHRTHGGARRPDSTPPEPPVLLRIQEQEQAKNCIGQAAAELVADGETIFLGSGSTALVELNQAGARVIVAPDPTSTEPPSSRKRAR